MGKVRIKHDREKCIGCGACVAICSQYWEMADDGKAKLKKSKNNVLELASLGCNKEAAEACPVNIIRIG